MRRVLGKLSSGLNHLPAWIVLEDTNTTKWFRPRTTTSSCYFISLHVAMARSPSFCGNVSSVQHLRQIPWSRCPPLSPSPCLPILFQMEGSKSSLRQRSIQLRKHSLHPPTVLKSIVPLGYRAFWKGPWWESYANCRALPQHMLSHHLLDSPMGLHVSWFRRIQRMFGCVRCKNFVWAMATSRLTSDKPLCGSLWGWCNNPRDGQIEGSLTVIRQQADCGRCNGNWRKQVEKA